MRALVISPHNDDETLFAAFTIQKFAAHVVVCFPSERDYGDTRTRIKESARAVMRLGGTFEQIPEGVDIRDALSKLSGYVPVFAPDQRTGHPQHRLVADVARDLFRGRLITYHTYDEGGFRVTSDRLVDYSPEMVQTKLLALAEYRTQLMHPRACKFFLQDQREYYGSDL